MVIMVPKVSKLHFDMMAAFASAVQMQCRLPEVCVGMSKIPLALAATGLLVFPLQALLSAWHSRIKLPLVMHHAHISSFVQAGKEHQQKDSLSCCMYS